MLLCSYTTVALLRVEGDVHAKASRNRGVLARVYIVHMGISEIGKRKTCDKHSSRTRRKERARLTTCTCEKLAAGSFLHRLASGKYTHTHTHTHGHSQTLNPAQRVNNACHNVHSIRWFRSFGSGCYHLEGGRD